MNTKNLSKTITILVLTTLLLSACGAPEEVEPTVDVASAMAESVQQTVAAMMATQNSVPTATSAPTATPEPPPAPTSAAPSVPVAAAPTTAPVQPNCWIADLISETVPDGTMYRKNETFTKEWRIINGGTCTWTTAYKFHFVDGYSMGAPADPVPLPESVAPGMSTTVKIKMTAPNDIGTFNGNWVLKSDTGVDVGKFNVQIVTGDKPFAVTRVDFGVQSITKGCPYEYSVPISITTDGAGTVRYGIYDQVGGPITSGELTFSAAGTQTVTYKVTYSIDSDIKIWVNIKEPNNQVFSTKEYNFVCK